MKCPSSYKEALEVFAPELGYELLFVVSHTDYSGTGYALLKKNDKLYVSSFNYGSCSFCDFLEALSHKNRYDLPDYEDGESKPKELTKADRLAIIKHVLTTKKLSAFLKDLDDDYCFNDDLKEFNERLLREGYIKYKVA